MTDDMSEYMMKYYLNKGWVDLNKLKNETEETKESETENYDLFIFAPTK